MVALTQVEAVPVREISALKAVALTHAQDLPMVDPVYNREIGDFAEPPTKLPAYAPRIADIVTISTQSQHPTRRAS